VQSQVDKRRAMRCEPVRTRSEGAGACGWCGERPYRDAAAKRRSVAPVASERGAGVPSLTVRAGGDLVGGVPACLIVESAPRPVVTPPSAASAGFSVNENIPCSAPSTVVTQDRHGGRKWLLASRPGWGGAVSAPPHPGSTHAPKGKKRALDSRHAGFI